MNVVLSAFLNGAILSLALAAALWFLMRVTPRWLLNAATRYLVWWAALLITVSAPLFYLPYRHVKPVALPAARTPFHEAVIPVPVPTEAPRMPAPIVHTPPPKALVATPIPTPKHFNPPALPIRINPPRWPRYLLALWAFISLVQLTRLAMSCILLERLRRRAHPLATPNWIALLGAARRRIDVASSAEIDTPVAAGPWRPTILIPDRLLTELTAEELDQVGLHEAAHLARFDDCALLIQRILESLFAPHPAVLWIARQLDLEREIACDDIVVAASGQPRAYARCLTRVIELSGQARSLAAAGAAEDRSQLARRITALLDKSREISPCALKSRLVTALVMIGALTWAGVRAPQLIAFAMPLAQSVSQATTQRAAAPPAAPPQTEPQTLEGRVIEDTSNNPLPSVELRFHQAGKVELAADLETDRAGRFNAAELPPGDYTVEVSKPNYITTTVKMRAPAAGLTIPLIHYAVIAGHVTDSTGNPQPGRIHAYDGRTQASARVAIMQKTRGSGELRAFRNAEVDDNGHYRVYDLPPGQYAVGFWYAGVKDGSGMQLYPDTAHPKIFPVAGGEDYEAIDSTTTPGASFDVRGKIDLPDSRQQFQLSLGMPEQPTLPIAQAVTQPDGTFRLEKVPSGTYDLFVSGPTWGRTAYDWIVRDEALFGRTQIQVIGQNLEGITVPLTPSRSLNVQLGASDSKTPTGCPQTATLTITTLEPWSLQLSSRTQVSFEKPATIRNLPPGRLRIAANELGSACYQVKEQEVNLNGDAPDPLVIELAAAGSIHGTTKTGSGVELRDQESRDNPEPRLVYPDAQGHFAFDSLRPGRYRLSQSGNTADVEVRGGAATSVGLGARP